ncbi:hypothetical protein PTE30175_03648 [Pandoraea terrae]|uniref:Uncharacterized protein n=1 Tax=Pandoraea terrae TaxID=1537710 RepID=A0A5E4X9P1_9BURK|nr:hypothetical protein PTE30175_03648 [Pandoraea terrae]
MRKLIASTFVSLEHTSYKADTFPRTPSRNGWGGRALGEVDEPFLSWTNGTPGGVLA